MINEIAVIDYMIDFNVDERFKENVKIYRIDIEEDEIDYLYGHGNAVCSIFLNIDSNIKINLFPIHKKTKPSSINNILKYIINQTSIQIVSMSCGYLLYNHDIKEMEEICRLFLNDGRVIIAAYPNNNFISYPAVFPTVLGVDVKNRIPDFLFQDKEIAEIRFVWRKELSFESRENSFITSYITYEVMKKREIVLDWLVIHSNSRFNDLFKEDSIE